MIWFALMKKFDYIIIGSSPILLMKAISLSREKYKVCLIEKNNFIGGSWKTFRYMGKNYDAASHFLEYDKSTKKIFKSFNVELNNTNYDPHFLYKNYFYNIKNPIENAILKSKLNKKNILRKIFLFIKILSRSFWEIKNSNFYFAGGCSEMLKTLTELCKDNKIKIYLNYKCEKIMNKNNNLQVLISNKKIFTSNHVITGLGLDMIKKDSLSIISIAIKIKFRLPKKFYYLKIIDSKYLKRISYLDKLKEGDLLIIESDIFDLKKDCINNIRNNLINEFTELVNMNQSIIEIINFEIFNPNSLDGFKKYYKFPDLQILNTKSLSFPHLQNILK